MTNALGLSSAEAERRHREQGPNEIVPSSVASRLHELKDILLDPMGLMLLTLATLYALIGDRTDALILLLAYIPITAVDVVLKIRATQALRALRATLKPTAKVLRDGEVREVPTRALVAGDVIVFEEGQSIPADGRILESHQLAVNEAALTGESLPVDKDVDNVFFGGTLVLQGRGLGLIEQIGRKTRFGQIAKLMEETVEESSPLQKKVHHLISRVGIVALGLALSLFALRFWQSGELLPSVIVALTFGMAAVPEEFPLVFTLYLSMGAWRLSRHGVLVKSLPSVEALGSVDVICTDKTGTLTEGRFQLEELLPIEGATLRDDLWLRALMACEVTPVDAMEVAIFEKADSSRPGLAPWKLKWDYPFERLGKHMSHVWENERTGQMVMAMKGATEGVLEHCEVDALTRSKIINQLEALAGQGKRVLGLAAREGTFGGDREQDEKGLSFVAFLVFSDPIRTSVRAAVEACQSANIEIKMLTGDHPLTAHAVADETGIAHFHEHLFTGDQLAQMTKEQRRESYLQGAIFSRVLPEQKYEMVDVLKDAGRVVAMTGDGINDAPALKLADIGISMGKSATDVARSSAQMILMNNDFKGIVEAVFEGRRIFANLKRSFSYLISFHIPIVLLTLLPSSLGWGDLLLPIHIVLLELIVHPVSAFAFENLPARAGGEKSIMPRRRFWEATLSGVLLSAGSLALYRYFSMQTADVSSARTLALAAVLLGNIFFVFVETWPVKSVRLLWTTLSLLVLTAAVVWIPFLARVFHLQPVDVGPILLALGVGALASLPTFISRWKSESSSNR